MGFLGSPNLLFISLTCGIFFICCKETFALCNEETVPQLDPHGGNGAGSVGLPLVVNVAVVFLL